jgi:hypothetical protein
VNGENAREREREREGGGGERDSHAYYATKILLYFVKKRIVIADKATFLP